LSRSTATSRRWKKAAALHCAIVLRPDLDTRGLKKLAKAILSLGAGDANEGRSPPQIEINDAQVTEMVWCHSQCIEPHCPLLIFGKQLADELNEFFDGDEDENPRGRGRRSPASLAE